MDILLVMDLNQSQSGKVVCSFNYVFYLCLYRYDVHEKKVGAIAEELGFTHVSLSSVVMPMVRIVPRGYTGI
jgi:N-methylhydantoinase A/oxoprolinase/acetone carboxylase beta subunit